VLAASAGILALYVGGIAQLTVLTGSVSRAIVLGVTPFALLDLGKAVFAALITRGVSGRRESRAAHA
jgi:biotin transporter BioY